MTAAVAKPRDHALKYAAMGIPVFPCGSDKAPLTAHGFKAATTDPELIRQWWVKWPTALIGIPTGTVSGIAALDLDVKNGKDGLAHVPDWQTLSPCRSRTQSGGAHLFFDAKGAPRNSSDDIALGVDTRGEGGYFIAPGSPGYHWIGESQDFSNLPPWPDAYRPNRERAVSNARPGRQRAVSNVEKPTLRLVRKDKPPSGYLGALIEKDAGKGVSKDSNDVWGPASLEEIAGAADVIPNPDLGWERWNRIGMTLWAATKGSDEGRELFHRFSQKSKKKYDRAATDRRWESYFNSPPRRVTVGTLFFEAYAADPSWRDALGAGKHK